MSSSCRSYRIRTIKQCNFYLTKIRNASKHLLFHALKNLIKRSIPGLEIDHVNFEAHVLVLDVRGHVRPLLRAIAAIWTLESGIFAALVLEVPP